MARNYVFSFPTLLFSVFPILFILLPLAIFCHGRSYSCDCSNCTDLRSFDINIRASITELTLLVVMEFRIIIEKHC
jgi:hypothetical protein